MLLDLSNNNVPSFGAEKSAPSVSDKINKYGASYNIDTGIITGFISAFDISTNTINPSKNIKN